MTLSRSLWLCLACLAIVSISGKIAFESRTDYGSLTGEFLELADRVLSASRFATFRNPQATGGIRKDCQVWLSPARPEGGTDVYFAEEFGNIGKVVFLYRGQIYESRPTFTVVFYRRMERVRDLFRAEAKPIRSPLFQVAYSPGCKYNEIGELAAALSSF